MSMATTVPISVPRASAPLAATPLWQARDVAAALSLPAADVAVAAAGAAAGWQASGVSIDSRSVAPGDIFIALKGPHHDGHDYLAPARDRGAVAAMVAHGRAVEGLPLIPVADTHAGLWALARAARARMGGRILAVTGSVGKTGTKDALLQALGEQGLTHGTAGNLNNEIGLPLSLARMPADAAFGVFELGMNHAGELHRLSRLLRPHVALITTVEAVHLAFFADIAAIADAKAEIFDGLEPGGVAVLNRDNPLYHQLRDRAWQAGCRQIRGFGAHPDADARLTGCSVAADGSDMELTLMGRAMACRIGAPGRHWMMNALGALLAAHALGADPDPVAACFARLRASPGRGATSRVSLPGGGAIMLIDESYNASPASMRAALAVLGRMHPAGRGRRIAALGDMLELGPDAAALHAGLAGAIAGAGIERVFSCGPLMKHLHDALPPQCRGGWAADSAGLAPMLVEFVRAGDVVMLKGSLGSRMRVVRDGLVNPAVSAAAASD